MQPLKGRLPLTAKETSAVDALIKAHPDEPVSMTRRDPDEKGPLLVHVGDTTHEVAKTGKTREV